ncbi:MAG: hypothetical protein ACOYNL_05970, partial [Rickettsiales bacterium]
VENIAPAKSAFSKGFGRNMATFAKFQPAKMSALIGASFTFYRGTSKLGKWLTEYLFNPKDTEQRTAEKVDDLPQEIVRKVKEIAPAEVSSTPIAAIVLGFIVSAFQKPANFASDPTKPKDLLLKDVAKGIAPGNCLDWSRQNFKATQGFGNKAKLLGSVVAHPNAKFVSQAIINTLGYSLFFELGDRLFKDTQIRRGVWPGEHHSIKALKAAPDEYAKGIEDGNTGLAKPKFEDGAVEAAPEKDHYGAFTKEPSLFRFAMRRVAPTAIGITAYTAAKMRWAQMAFNDFNYNGGPINLKQFGKKALGEGLATSLFFLIPIFSEQWEKAYDNFFAKKEKIAQMKDELKKHPELMVAKALTPHQEVKYDELLGRVIAKEKAAANDGQYQIRA